MKTIRALLAGTILLGSASVVAQPDEGAHDARPVDMADWAKAIQQNYPSEALMKGVDGTVTMRIDIGADGRVSSCEVTETSGSPVLDSSACSGMETYARYEPARDAQGQSIASSTTQSVRYVLPKNAFVPPAFDHPVPVQENAWREAAFDREYNAALREADVKYVVFQLVIDESGNPSGCGMNVSTGDAALDRQGCAALLEHAQFKPAMLPNADKVPGSYWIGHSPDARRQAISSE